MEPITEFRNHPTSLVSLCVIPESSLNRKMTNTKWFYPFFGLIIISVLFTTLYTLPYSDIRRFTNGYDYCGNLCGVKNAPVDYLSCSGKNMTSKPFCSRNSIDSNKYECFKNCNSEQNSCNLFNEADIISSKFFPVVIKNIQDNFHILIILSLLGLGYSILSLFLVAKFSALTIVIGNLVLNLIFIVIFCLVLIGKFGSNTSKDDPARRSLALSIISTIPFTVLIVICSIIFCKLKTMIKLIVPLFDEAIKMIIFVKPSLLLISLIVFIINSMLVAIFIYTFVLMQTSGILTRTIYSEDYVYEYDTNFLIILNIILNTVVFIWVLQFSLSCQKFIAGTIISALYFKRGDSTIINSLKLLKHHLGSMIYGSLFLSVLGIIRWSLRVLCTLRHFGWMFIGCLKEVEMIAVSHSSLGYIEIAMHGQQYSKSSRRVGVSIAFHYLIGVDGATSFALYSFQFFVMMSTMITGTIWTFIQDGTINSWVVITAVSLGSIIFSHCLFSLFKTVVDAIVLCFCEDLCIQEEFQCPLQTPPAVQECIKKVQDYVKEKEQKEINESATA